MFVLPNQAVAAAAAAAAVRIVHHSIPGSHLGMHYTVPLAELNPDEWKAHKQVLTFTPESGFSARNPFMKPPPPLRLWGERGGFAIVPCPYGIHWFGEPTAGETQCSGTLLPTALVWNPACELWGPGDKFDQQHVLAEVRAHWASAGPVARGLIFEAPTSAGKTAMACRLIAEQKVKTLVIVPGQTVFTQWPSRLEKFLPGVRVGRMQGAKRCEYEDKDVVVAMLKSLVVCEYPAEAFDGFGLVIFDEVHTVPAKTYIKALSVVGRIQRKLGLTATFERRDKMHKLLSHSIGPLVHRADPVTEASKKTLLQPIVFHGGRQTIVRMRTGDYNFVEMLNALAEDPFRTRCMANELAALFSQGRRVAVIADRVELLATLHTDMQKRFPEKNLFHYVCETKKVKREAVDTEVHDGIFASYGLFGLGTDITYLDTILLATGRSTIEQPVGRLRALCTFAERQDLLIVDWVDAFSLFESQYHNARTKVYKKKAFIMQEPIEIEATAEELLDRNRGVLQPPTPVLLRGPGAGIIEYGETEDDFFADIDPDQTRRKKART
jgi:superfamily II DNA or RNA helicase